MTGLLTLRHLAFTGPAAVGAGLAFEDGLNILYGASNTGKSFALKGLNFMFGASKPLPSIDEAAPYDTAWLGLRLPGGAEVTLSRSVKGHGFLLHPGLVTAPSDVGRPLGDVHDPKSDDNLSMFLLDLLGLKSNVVVRNASGEKDSLSFRYVAPYLFTSEETIISERSPVLASGQHTSATVERNVFKLLLTGIDDRAVTPSLPPKTQAAVRAGKIELVDDWIAGIDRELGDTVPSRGDLQEQSHRLDASIAALRHDLGHAQDRLDALVRERRATRDERDETRTRAAELDLTLDRFARLDQVYVSDIERLRAVEEGGTLLLAMAGCDCPVCGALPEAQVNAGHVEEIGRSHMAAAAEIRKIQRDRADLAGVMQSLRAETTGLRGRVGLLADALAGLDAGLDEARPAERDFRQRYEGLNAERARVSGLLDLYARRDRLVVERSRLDVPAARKPANEAAAVGLDGPTAHAYAQVVQEVLGSWGFPGNPTVSFDLDLQDIRLDGKARSDNGKGVRALLHAAMKVAVLQFCHRRRLPHPGFVVLDTPLLTYREPLRSRHGPLSEDEEALKGAGIGSRFYEHLAGLSEIGQFLVIENSDPPAGIERVANVQAFSGEAGVGRYGLFPLPFEGSPPRS
ncbi:hypothetical protein QO001_003891 [Methylobacterium brachiatum]|uniref:AAA domain-containing protein n=1 Tax=Methylobacterium brachiatum TaxID=269660 RepID=A0AAJ1TQ87_9HYPH|nr:hypothetical protein [Methylobacterium brachiatum]MCB4806090.1 hypothetical protein [Methylobacterium brachiatum]MDQ0544955.1 hypothetical protein [Methylobacterium brachiatum]